MERDTDWVLVSLFAISLLVFAKESREEEGGAGSLRCLVPVGALVARALEGPYGPAAATICALLAILDEERTDVPLRTKAIVLGSSLALLAIAIFGWDARVGLALASLGAVFATKLGSGLAPPATRLAAGLILAGVALLEPALNVAAVFLCAMEQ